MFGVFWLLYGWTLLLVPYYIVCVGPFQQGNEKDHRVKFAIGNGIRTDVWTEFLKRFGDIKVRELYGATEGNIGFINYTSKIGVVGRVNLLHRVGGAALSPSPS